jgi:hypothetical protein
MLLPAQVMPFLAHEDAIVREQAVRYFSNAHDVAPLTAEDCWAAIDAVGLGQGAVGLILLLREVPQSDASTARLLAALDLPADESMRGWLLEALEAVEFDQLRRHAEAIFARGDLPKDTREHLQARLELADELVAARLWEKLEAHAKEIEEDELYWDEIDHRIKARLVEAIARFGQDSTDRALNIVRNAGEDGDTREIFAINVLGRMRHRPALDTLLRTLAGSAEDDDVLHEALQDAIPRLAGVDLIAPLEALLPTLPWGTSLYTLEMLSRIRHPDAEAALLRLLEHPKLSRSHDDIADALTGLCTTDGLAALRQMVLADNYDAQIYDLKAELVACAMMAGANGVEFDLPELATLREEAVAQEIERQRRMEAMADGEGLDDLDDDLSADDFLDEEDLPDLPPALDDRRPRVTAPLRRDPATPGRNDPCPCGSGKKYKKCCLNKSA